MTRLVLDARALQDENYARKGIGRHTLNILAALKAARPGTRIQAIVDPRLPAVVEEAAAIVDGTVETPWAIDGDVYLNPSPTTHDTSGFVLARRFGLATAAIVHDFIPLRVGGFSPEGAGHYNYLVATLGRYDLLIPNSDFTAGEIAAILPETRARIATVHGRSRFNRTDPTTTGDDFRAVLAETAGTYLLVGTADDPRKNPDIVVEAAPLLAASQLRIVFGGGLSADTQKRLAAEHPQSFAVGNLSFLPRLSENELREVYRGARAIVVPSRDEGFSLPVCEAIAMGTPVVASTIPAHAEQILDPALLFNPDSAEDLVRAVGRALEAGSSPDAYRRFDLDAETVALADALAGLQPPETPPARRPILVGPGADKRSGVAVFNAFVRVDGDKTDTVLDYVDLDSAAPEDFYRWLLDHQRDDVVYTVGNNDLIHPRAFDALQQVPGPCILHDSRMFEFLLNRFGPYYIKRLWDLRHPGEPVEIATVEEWQRERKRLKDSFLDDIVARANRIFVHSRVQVGHISERYGFAGARYLPFVTQLSPDERADILARREPIGTTEPASERRELKLVMFGELEPTKGCSEIIYALGFLRMRQISAELYFVGKYDKAYFDRLTGNALTVGVRPFVHFVGGVGRADYVTWLGEADVAVQLRYPLFGQVSGPVSDCVSCGVPLVTTSSLAVGMAVEQHCVQVPDLFTPLHISLAVEQATEAVPEPMKPVLGPDYLNLLTRDWGL